MNITLRNVGAFVMARVLILLGIVKRAQRKALHSHCILAVYFHAPSRELFESSIKWFTDSNFKFISVSDLEKIYKRESPFPKGAVLLTVDDGWLTNRTNVVATAERYNVPVAIFVSTEPIETGAYWWSYADLAERKKLIPYNKEYLKTIPNMIRNKVIEELKEQIKVDRQAMTVEQIKKIAKSKNIIIGGHTVTHPILTNCDDTEAFEEIKHSKMHLEEWVDYEVNFFSFPNGSYSAREIKCLKELNFSLAFTTEETYITPDKLQERFTLPRFYVKEGASFSENVCRMLGVWPSKG
ncbi:polysaccharide deacetylase family protein [Pontibacter anaerobius]|uniref:Polysaccharide deacetylase family protein n=1 Tax=Pontibacter anaerobius TaxID=2993940 RepID=A0ABT3RHY5_9BACT|nr:polysaccharide deacetylase family protein [Pontibacter anaerobius]MCX2740977.1 polysaccharide deacetylase family protein [Pontibacter anaerobius]